MAAILYELFLEDGTSASPFVWRIKYALAKKGLEYESHGLGFTDIVPKFGAQSRTVPILDDGGHVVSDSWNIADYLDSEYPDRPMLFSSPQERSMNLFFDKWMLTKIFPTLLTIYTLDVHDRANAQDRAYYRETREKRLGMTLEERVAGRETRIEAVREALEPLRLVLAGQPYLGGEEPNFADFISMGAFIWVGTVGTLPLLAANDSLLSWIDRGLDSYGGIGGSVELPGLRETR